MRRRSGFLTFLTSLIPGVGYMYLGLMKRGIQALALFIIIEPLFHALGLYGLTSIVRIPLWFYFLFDTFNIAHRLDRGEYIQDSDFIFERYFNGDTKHSNSEDPYNNNYDSAEFNKRERKKWAVIAWGIIIIGVLGLLNKIFGDSSVFYVIKENVSKYFIPVLFIAGGSLLLIKKS